MNKLLFAAIICAGILLVMCVFPPWQKVSRDGNIKIMTAIGYYPAFSPPVKYATDGRQKYDYFAKKNVQITKQTGIKIDTTRLIIQIAPIFLIGLGCFVYLIKSKKED